MRFGSLFSGIGGLDLGLELAGMQCVFQVEIDDYCTRVLEKHWPDVPKHRDIKDIESLPYADLICGGFPCPPVSLMGKHKGVKDDGWLWPEFYRIIRDIRPKYVLVENVAGLLVWGMGDVLRDLARCGYDAEWESIPAYSFGLPHRRRRVFIIAHSDKSKKWSGRFSGLPNGEVDDWKRLLLPDRGREAYGLPGGMDRLRGLGNAVVPQVAEWIGKRIIDFDKIYLANER